MTRLCFILASLAGRRNEAKPLKPATTYKLTVKNVLSEHNKPIDPKHATAEFLTPK